MTTGRVKALRVLSLIGAFGCMVVFFMYAMAPPGAFDSVIFTAGSGMFAGSTAFFATFVYGPLAYPRKSAEAFLARGIFVVLALGLIVVSCAAVRSLFTGIAGAA